MLLFLNVYHFTFRFEDRTVFEDMFVNYHHTTMYIRQQPSGYGLRCHRAVTELCKLIGQFSHHFHFNYKMLLF